MNKNVTAGQIVRIRPEWQDEGDDLLTWMSLDNSTDGSDVRVVPTNTGLRFPPVSLMRLEWLEI